MIEKLPNYLEDFICYQLKVCFKASREIKMNDKWYYQPRYALGNALKSSPLYSYLYQNLFAPASISMDGKQISPPSPLIIRVDNPSRFKLSKGEEVDIYITIVGADKKLVLDFISFIPEWESYNFFKDIGLKYCSLQVFNPMYNNFSNTISIEKSAITSDYFYRNLTKWNSFIEIQFLSPATIKINQTLDRNISFSTLINRISGRAMDFYRFCINREVQIDKYFKSESGEIVVNGSLS